MKKLYSIMKGRKMQRNIKPELLCPVGGRQQLIAAVENGADAVYFGGSNFNARIYADNFDSIESIKEAVDYAHLRNVKVYITLNTLVNDSELKSAIEYAAKLYEIGVDALIIQDIGLVSKIAKEIPDFKIHISTQGTIYSKEGIKYFDKYPNVERVVLARELSLNEIEQVVKNTDKEIEIFVHGALCVCYSGQCKLSSQIGARSGNRGKCAQPCRLPYKLVDENTNDILKENYYLSTKDICTIDILPKVISSGVHSLKIEGRMKSPEYVAAVTRIYRKYIDKCYEKEDYIVDKQDKNILVQVFNRGNFSEGYLKDKDSSKIWCSTKPKHLGTYLGTVLEYDERKANIKIKLEQELAIGDVIEVSNKELASAMISFIRNKKDRVKIANKGDIVTIGDIKGKINKNDKVYKITSKLLNEELKKYFSGKSLKKNKLDINVKLYIDKVPEIEMSTKIFDKEYKVTVKEGIKCERGINKVLTKQDVINQFMKTGDVPFVVNNINIELQKNVMTQISNLNNIRRQTIDMLSKRIIDSFKREKINVTNIKATKKIKEKTVATKLSIYVYRICNIKDISILNKVSRVYISLEDMINDKERILNNIDKEKICIYLPTVTNEKYKEYIYKNIETIEEIKNILVTNIEHLDIFKDMNLNIYLNNSFNIFNSEALAEICKNNIRGINLSNELTLEQITDMNVDNDKEIEIDIYGNLEAMYSNFCILNATKNCGKCTNKYSLADRKDKKFPVLFNNKQCTMQILNSDKLFSEEATKSLSNKVDYMRLYVYDENINQIENVINNVIDIINNKGVENKIVSNETEKYTNGHFYKKV